MKLGQGVNDTTVSRFWEVDAARGIAIIMVVFYHLIYDLDTFGGYGIKSTSGFWAVFADTSAFMFVFLAGLSLAISYSRASAVPRSGWELFGKYLRRGLRIFSYGMLITFVFWALQFGSVIFGILHLIGVSIVLAYPFMKLRLLNLFLGLSLVAVGVYMRIEDVSAHSAWLAPLGVVPDNLFMPDYRPLLPWFGVVLLGLFFGNVVYGDRRKKMPPSSEGPAYVAPVTFLGRHTLLIYLIHQPILIVTLWALGIVDLGFF
jgi:uncharacterized membrane protein